MKYSLPTNGYTFSKDEVEKWGAEVVEGTTQNTMKIRLVYVVQGKVTASAFVKVVDIKKYFDDCVILNICKSSTIGDLNYVGLISTVAKLNKIFCGRSMKFSFMWFAEDEKSPNHIA